MSSLYSACTIIVCLQPKRKPYSPQETELRLQAILRTINGEAYQAYKLAKEYNLPDWYETAARNIQRIVGKGLRCLSEIENKLVK